MQQWFLLAVAAGLASNLANYIARHIMRNNEDALAFSFYLELVKVAIFGVLAIFDFHINLSPKTLLLLLIIIISEPFAIFLYIKMHEYTHLSVSSIITRTRMIWVAIFALLFLGESLNFINYLGIAVVFLGLSVVVAPHKFFVDRGVKITTLFSLEVAIFVTVIKAISLDVSIPLIVLVSAIPSMFIFPLFMKNKKQTIISFPKTRLNAKILFALTNFIAFYGYILAIKSGPVSIVTALYQSMIVAGVIAGIVFLKEREDIAKKIVGSAVTVIGIYLLTYAF